MTSVSRIPFIALALGLALPCAAAGVIDRSFGAEQPAGAIRDAIEFQGELYVGGDFQVSGRYETPYVAKFVDGRWIKPLGTPPGAVERFLEHDGVLYIVGNARDPQGRPKGYVASYDGQNWNQIGAPFANALTTLSAIDGEMFAGGRGVFRWDGSTWQQESGITTGQVRWIAPYEGEIYAGHWSLGLYRRNGLSWNRWSWTFTSWDCNQLGSSAGETRAVVSRSSGLLIFGDLSGVKEVSGSGSLTSAAVVEFDGSEFQSVTTPWLQGCENTLEVESQIYDAVAVGDAIVAIGRFSDTFVVNEEQSGLAVHRDGSWNQRVDLTLVGAVPRLAEGASAAYVMNSTTYDPASAKPKSVGRLSAFDPLRQELDGIFEEEAYGQLGYSGELQPVSALATHFGAVIAGGFANLPAGVSLPPTGSVLQAFDTIGRHAFWVPHAMRPTAFLSTADGLYVADHQLLLRSDGRDQGETLVGSFDGPVRVIAQFDDELVFGGEFTMAEGAGLLHLARLDAEGTAHAMGDPDGPVHALANFDGELIVGGEFTQIGGVAAASIARWDGTQWSAMGDGFTRALFNSSLGRVNALWEYQGELYAAGDLLASGANTSIFHIAKWDGTSWQALTTTDLNAPARCLVEHDGLLFVGGDFTYAGGENVDHLAAFDGEAWRSFGAQADGSILAMATLDGDLYLGGEFTMLGGFYSFGLGRWRAEPRPEPQQPPPFFVFNKIVPNPFNPNAEIVLSLPRNGAVEVDIFDSRGRLVRALRRPYMLAGEARIVWNGFDDAGDDVASGSYWFRARFAGQTLTRSATLLR